MSPLTPTLETDRGIKTPYKEILADSSFSFVFVEDEKRHVSVVTMKCGDDNLGEVGFTISGNGIVEIGCAPYMLKIAELEQGKGYGTALMFVAICAAIQEQTIYRGRDISSLSCVTWIQGDGDESSCKRFLEDGWGLYSDSITYTWESANNGDCRGESGNHLDQVLRVRVNSTIFAIADPIERMLSESGRLR